MLLGIITQCCAPFLGTAFNHLACLFATGVKLTCRSHDTEKPGAREMNIPGDLSGRDLQGSPEITTESYHCHSNV